MKTFVCSCALLSSLFDLVELYRARLAGLDRLIIENDRSAGWECDAECEAVNGWLEEEGFILTHEIIGNSMHRLFVFQKPKLLN